MGCEVSRKHKNQTVANSQQPFFWTWQHTLPFRLKIEDGNNQTSYLTYLLQRSVLDDDTLVWMMCLSVPEKTHGI